MMRTLGATILIAAAIAATLTLARQRQPERRAEPQLDPGAAPLALDTDLDALRLAGF